MLKAFPFDIENKTRMLLSSLIMFIQDEEPKQYNNVRKLKCETCRNQEGRNKIYIYKYIYIPKLSIDKLLESYKISGYKANLFYIKFVADKYTTLKDTICNSITKYQAPRNKPNKVSVQPLHNYYSCE